MAPRPRQADHSQAVSRHPKAQNKIIKRKREVEDVKLLAQRVADLEIKPDMPPEEFSQLPLSRATQDGLKASHFTKLTQIQAQGIPTSLKGLDVLGAAKTGSGKTLSFIVPVLENLYRQRWTEFDGVGALILSPTRELAIQIFDVLRKVGRNHTFSAGLVIGGKSLQEERDRLSRMNILVATPGRMLQHMDQTADLDIGNLQMLVLDEADRIMDMGFRDAVDAIVEHLPKERQTLMFSATQTKKVSDLARLSLSAPEFVSVHQSAESATPSTLQQNYVLTPLSEKLDTLWSFLRANVKKKILVFFSSGKQVRFAYEAMRHLQPGIPLLHLHGRQKQTARLDITTKFSDSKYACLFSTDVAARGLDFPAVDWVVQADCPEDADTYIHRVGRTARYEHDGRAVLFLDPSEENGMLAALEQRRVTGVEEIHVKQKKMQHSIKSQLQNMCFKDPELKYLGQKAFVSYVRSVYVQKDKDIFNVKKLDLEGYASSMGLPGAPRVKFVKGEDAKMRKNMPRALAALEQESDGTEEPDDQDGMSKRQQKEKPTIRTKYDRMFERRNQDVLAEHYTNLIDDGQSMLDGLENTETADADEDDGFMAVKRRFEAGDEALGVVSDAFSRSKSRSNPGDLGQPQLNSNVEEPTTNNIGSKTPTETALATRKAIKLSDNPDATPLIVDSNRRSKLLKSKKALLKYKGHGSHLVFSDDDENGEGKEKVYYEKEDEFIKKGNADEQRAKFLEGERERVREADEVDRQVAREKRREKKIKRKEREKLVDLESDDETGGHGKDRYEVQLGGNGVHIPVDLGPYSTDDDGDDNEGGAYVADETYGNHESSKSTKQANKSTQEEPKRKRKWFEDMPSDEEDGNTGHNTRKGHQKSKRAREIEFEQGDDHEPQTLEDLEAMASGLLTT